MLGLRTAEGLDPGKYWQAKKVEKNSHSFGVAKDNPTKPGCSRKILGTHSVPARGLCLHHSTSFYLASQVRLLRTNAPPCASPPPPFARLAVPDVAVFVSVCGVRQVRRRDSGTRPLSASFAGGMALRRSRTRSSLVGYPCLLLGRIDARWLWVAEPVVVATTTTITRLFRASATMFVRPLPSLIGCLCAVLLGRVPNPLPTLPLLPPRNLRADCAQARGGFTERSGGVAAAILRAYGGMPDRFGRLEGTERRRRARSARHLRRNRSF